MTRALNVRPGTVADTNTLLALFDEAVRWLVARGQTGQWGSEPFSSRPEQRRRANELAGSGGMRIAEYDGEAVGALAVGEPPTHVPAIAEPELYIKLLLTSRRRAGQNIGGALVQEAILEAQRAGVALVRVDCWAEAPTLVGWYERQGFRRAGAFQLENGWRGQIFELRLSSQQADLGDLKAPLGSALWLGIPTCGRAGSPAVRRGQSSSGRPSSNH